MLRMTPLASAIVALLLGIEAYAAEETFDTHFMIGGMKDQQVANIRLDDNQPLPGQYDIDIYVNKQWRGKYEIIVKDNPQETCLSREVIKRLGINSDNFASGKQCLTFEQLVQGGAIPRYRGFSSRFQCPAGPGGRTGKWLCSTGKLGAGY